MGLKNSFSRIFLYRYLIFITPTFVQAILHPHRPLNSNWGRSLPPARLIRNKSLPSLTFKLFAMVGNMPATNHNHYYITDRESIMLFAFILHKVTADHAQPSFPNMAV